MIQATPSRTQVQSDQLMWKFQSPLLVDSVTFHLIIGCSQSEMAQDRNTLHYQVKFYCQFSTYYLGLDIVNLLRISTKNW